MDNPEELVYQLIEENYLKDVARFNKGDIVYYKPYVNSTEMSIGIVHEVKLMRSPVIRNGKEDSIMVIRYDILNPKGIINIPENRMCSASEWIFREFLKHSSANK